MNKAWTLGLLGLSLLATPAAAQTTPKKVTIYLAADGTQLPSADGADHRAEITLRDSVSGMMKEYFPSGKIRRIVPYAHVGQGIRHGVEMTYDENGKLRRRQEFVAGQRQGELQLFDAAGTLSRKVTFDQDKKTGQQCFTVAGEPKECKTEKVLPAFPDGANGVIRAIERAVVLSASDATQGKFGVVDIKFVVDKNAHISGASLVKATSPSLGQAVIAALDKIKFLESGQVNGEPVAVLYTLTIKVSQPSDPWMKQDAALVNERRTLTTFLEEAD
ncbi:hypothetical protein Q5H93_04060 [Hymenobacter sp. ASUV-10]|uniref:TonB C-terminal domain-containing protein n=1 Tax=Hymenobacter aranciens TaxID=3063996 RepID=A0ABT9BB16_9BACT|nr:hypothetical protein [Hymenobacter sp. ASUV-10]MDO7873896.1 hypothetical protein [Hymenobacter sp. ASUV-10]